MHVLKEHIKHCPKQTESSSHHTGAATDSSTRHIGTAAECSSRRSDSDSESELPKYIDLTLGHSSTTEQVSL